MKINLPALKEAAKAATPGPWKAIKSSVDIERIYIWAGDLTEIAKVEGTTDNTEHIAACDPTTVLALIEALEQMRATLIKMSKDKDEGGCEGYYGTEAFETLAAISEKLEFGE